VRSFLGISILSIALLLTFDLQSCGKFFEIKRQRPMAHAIIFDLDSCLAAADEVGEQLFAPAFVAIRVVPIWRIAAVRSRSALGAGGASVPASLLVSSLAPPAAACLRHSRAPGIAAMRAANDAVGVRVEATPRRLVRRATPPSLVRGI
jgi:hypothetical protein